MMCFEEALKDHAYILKMIEARILVEHGLLKEYNFDTAKIDTRRENIKSVFDSVCNRKHTDQEIQKAYEDVLNADIDGIQVNPFKALYYAEIYSIGKILKNYEGTNAQLLQDLFKAIDFFEVRESCEDAINQIARKQLKKKFEELHQSPYKAPMLYQQMLQIANEVKEDNPLFDLADFNDELNQCAMAWLNLKLDEVHKSPDQILTLYPQLIQILNKIKADMPFFNAADFIDRKEAKRMDRYTQFAIAATKLAFEDANMDLSKEDKERIGVFIGSGIGGIETLHDQYNTIFTKGPGRVSPFCVPMMISNMAAGMTSITFGLQGPSVCPVTACATGTNAIGDAMRVIQRGEADVMVAGGTEACISPLPVAGFASMKALCTDMNDNPQKASRPFDKNRSGFIMGEGAGIVILESYEHAVARGAEIYAELAGYASTSDAYHMTSPDPEAKQSARCFTNVVKDAGLELTDIDYINAHGTSTPLNERTETAAIKRAFGDHAYKLSISSIKSMIGHLLGAAGGIECIATALAVKNDIMPATINYETPD